MTGFNSKRDAAADKMQEPVDIASIIACREMLDAQPVPAQGPAAMDDRQRLEAIVSVINKYLPPDGIPINDAMSEIIGYVDPLPPPQRPWVGLTEEERNKFDRLFQMSCSSITVYDQICRVETKLKEKNG